MDMARAAILFGGQSNEHEISLRSAAAVLANLPSHYSPILIGITHQGHWYLQNPEESSADRLDGLEIKKLPQNKILLKPGEGFADIQGRIIPVDIVIPILHGSYGEDGCLQGLLEMLNLPYAGSSVIGNSVAMDKNLAKLIWQKAGLPVVPWKSFSRWQHPSDSQETAHSLFSELRTELGAELFIKPVSSGSSIGIQSASNPQELQSALENAWKYDNEILVEKRIEGREIECAVIGNNTLETFPPGEIITKNSRGFYDYKAKYLDPNATELKIPASLEQNQSRKIQEMAIKACKSIHARGFARVDFFIESKTNHIYINEIQTIPGMTSASVFPRLVASGGINFPALLERLINHGLEDYKLGQTLIHRYTET